jgi:hypothetical protein
MTQLNAGRLNAQNIGSTIDVVLEAERAQVLGTIQHIRKLEGIVEITLSNGDVLELAPTKTVGIILPPGAHFQREAMDTLDSMLGELEDLSEEVVAYIKAKARAVVALGETNLGAALGVA